MLLTYDEYKGYGGGLDETAFKIYEYEAEKRVDTETHGRIKTVTEPVKRCVARLTDIMSKSDVTENKVTSWNNDGVSKSIKDFSADDYNNKINDIIRNYLANEVGEDGTPLLYLGVGCYD